MVYNIPTWYYRQFDADYTLDVPAEGYGGWQKDLLPIEPDKTAVAIMHAWDCGTYEQYPGWYRAVEYIPRANKIAETVFPPLISKIRSSGMKLFHVAAKGYGENYPGYEKTLGICEKYSAANPITKLPPPEAGETRRFLSQFKKDHSFVGSHNEADKNAGYLTKDFMKQAMPLDNEPIALDCEQLHAVCLEYNINHLVYIGFAINWCLQYSPGNMNDMFRRGFMCSTIRQAVTAVENKISARHELHKEHGLWVTAIQNGFVYDLDDFMEMLGSI
jgi:hypothetical protein